MHLNRYKTMSEAVGKLEKRGFKSNFKLEPEKEKMRCLTTQELYAPKDMRIVEYHRFEGQSNPSDVSIIFAVECTDGNKGTVISSFDLYADVELTTFMDKVKVKIKV